MALGNLTRVGDLVAHSDSKNPGLGRDSVEGVSTNKEFIRSKANLDNVDVSNYKLVQKYEIAYAADTSRRGDKISIALNLGADLLVSKIYVVFKVKESQPVLPEYLFLWFRRPEFDRYARFHSWGSARETFDWNDFCEVTIPLPSLDVQLAIVNIFRSLQQRRRAYKSVVASQKRVARVFYAGIMRRDIGSAA
jgi:type I restriction enzyme S subunit